MAAWKCICPGCQTTLEAPGPASMILCPRCGLSLTRGTVVPQGTVVDDSFSPDTKNLRPQENHVLIGVIVLCVLMTLIGGGVGAIYLLSTSIQPSIKPPVVAQPATPKEEPPPQAPSPVMIARVQEALPPPSPPLPTIAGPLPLYIRVNQAIDRGVTYLKKELKQFPPGAPYEGLVGWALLECGVAPDDPDMQQIAARLRDRFPQMVQTYQLALAIIFFDRLGKPSDAKLIREAALRLVAGQRAGCLWSYPCPILTDSDQAQLLDYLTFLKKTDPDDARRTGAAYALPAHLRPGAIMPAPARRPRRHRGGDMSNTQFATLALWVARRHGVPVEAILDAIARHLRAAQRTAGNWGYNEPGDHWPASAVCSGLLGVAVGRGIADAHPQGAWRSPVALDQDQAIIRGLQFLGKTFAELPRPNQGGRLVGADAHGDLYFLWSLERVAMIYHLKVIGGREWYPWTAELLVNAQKEDGRWQDAFDTVVDTCFALLILKRTHVAQDLTPILLGSKKRPQSLPQLPGIDYMPSGPGEKTLSPVMPHGLGEKTLAPVQELQRQK